MYGPHLENARESPRKFIRFIQENWQKQKPCKQKRFYCNTSRDTDFCTIFKDQYRKMDKQTDRWMDSLTRSFS